MQVTIRKLTRTEPYPYDLLLLADPSRDVIDSYLPLSDVYLAQNEDGIIGEYVLLPIDADHVEIKNIAVSEAFQGCGVGKFLLAHACTTAQESGFKKIKIGTANSSIAQLYLYQRQGFDMDEIRKNFFVQHYPETIYENGILAKHMIMLVKNL